MKCPSELLMANSTSGTLTLRSFRSTRACPAINPTAVNPRLLPCLPLAARSRLPQIRGIYFVLNAHNEVLYIGQSKNLRSRWLNRTHHRYNELAHLNDLRLAYLKVTGSNPLSPIERALVDYFKPRMNNKAGPACRVQPQRSDPEQRYWRFRSLMVRKRMSSEQLAKLIGRDWRTIDRWRSTPTMPPIGEVALHKLCQALDCDLSDLYWQHLN